MSIRPLHWCLPSFLIVVFAVFLSRTGAAQDRVEPGFPQAAVDYFKDMDGGVSLKEREIRGRNTWMLWTAGNEAFWDYLSTHSFGTIDILKIMDSRHRRERFARYGMMNEPGFKQAEAPDANGLWMDEADGTQDPYYSQTYRETFPKDEFTRVYGRASGILGLRLFPNPAFEDPVAKQAWELAADKRVDSVLGYVLFFLLYFFEHLVNQSLDADFFLIAG